LGSEFTTSSARALLGRRGERGSGMLGVVGARLKCIDPELLEGIFVGRASEVLRGRGGSNDQVDSAVPFFFSILGIELAERINAPPPSFFAFLTLTELLSLPDGAIDGIRRVEFAAWVSSFRDSQISRCACCRSVNHSTGVRGIETRSLSKSSINCSLWSRVLPAYR